VTEGEPAAGPRSWPPGRDFPDGEAIAAACAQCGTPWRVHTSLAGFRMRCTCGAWLDVPAPPQPRAHLAATARDERGLAVLPGDTDEDLLASVPTNVALAPGELTRASASNRARWTSRTLLEFAAMLAALVGPQLAAFLLAKGNEWEQLLPFASLCSGVLVAIVVVVAGPWGSLGFRAAKPRYWLEVLPVAGAGVLLALGWLRLLEAAFDDLPIDGLDNFVERLGLPMALAVIAVAPALLEEVMFRGLLQGRLLALLGTRAGIAVTAAAFALCHGQPLVLPIHVGIGLYLSWLRLRSDSLLPGMLLHFLYNGALVVLSA
jgi:membrane protease YdiL (CAAX protease family)